MRAGWWIGWLAAELRDGGGSGLQIGISAAHGPSEDYELIIFKSVSSYQVKNINPWE
ncbi:MAG: hypothetical protein RL553_2329 [Planctomycetota bacterium]|jgi:hypothetical protein